MTQQEAVEDRLPTRRDVGAPVGATPLKILVLGATSGIAEAIFISDSAESIVDTRKN